MGYPVLAELVAVSWLRTFLTAGVATSLPARDVSWEATGFVRVGSTGGAPHLYTGRQASVLSLDAFAFTEGSRQPPYGFAGTILGDVKARVDGKAVSGRVVTPAGYLDARLLGAAVNADPVRVPDEGGLAHYTMGLQLWWVPIAEEA